MQTILVLNAKGGSGKTTIATNMAGALAASGRKVTLVDCDPQGSSLDWLAVRPPGRPAISGLDGTRGNVRPKAGSDFVVIDAPSGTRAKQLSGLVRRADKIVMPVLPSPLDIRAATRFLAELLAEQPVASASTRLTTVANRVREGTRAADDLEDFLEEIRLPGGRHVRCSTVLRMSQNYIRAAERGLSVFEFAPFATLMDREQWKPLMNFVRKAR